jgi:hypothetical protein
MQSQINHLNVNLKREIDERINGEKNMKKKINALELEGHQFRLASHFLDERISKLEKKIGGGGIIKSEDPSINKTKKNN